MYALYLCKEFTQPILVDTAISNLLVYQAAIRGFFCSKIYESPHKENVLMVWEKLLYKCKKQTNFQLN